MPTDTLTAPGNGTEVTVGSADTTVSLAGTWSGSMRLERRTSGTAAWRPVALNASGEQAVFMGVTGDMLVAGVPTEPDARLRWVCTRLEAGGSVTARIGVA
jgi:hypothetical protein